MARSRMGRCSQASALVLALAWFIPTGYAHAADPTLIHACVNKNSGEIKIVAPTASCKANETALSWPSTVATGGDGGLLYARSNFIAGAGATKFAMFVEEGTEPFVQVAVPRSGTLANLFVHPTDSPAGGAVMTVTVRINGANTALTVTHSSGDGTNTKSNTVDTVTVNQGDFVTVQFTESGGVAPLTVYRASFEFR